MNWKVVQTQLGFLDLLTIISIFLSIFFIANGSYSFGFIILLFFIYAWVSKFYLRHIIDYLEIKNEKQKMRLFPGDTVQLSIELSQKGLMPMMNGELEFKMENNVSSTIYTYDKNNKFATYRVPINLKSKDSQNIRFEIKGMKRGVTKLTEIKLHVTNILGIGSTTFQYSDAFLTEIVVFPSLKPVKGVEKIFSAYQGATPIRSSLYEDLTMPVGTRDYAIGDPFNRINWKASARTNQIQTKLFEKTNDMTWTVMLNVMSYRTKYSANIAENLEEILSQLAYTLQVATHYHIPFSLHMNFRSKGDRPYLLLDQGEGTEHFMKALELLSHIKTDQAVLPMKFVASQVDRKSNQMPIVVLHGEVNENERKVYEKWEKKGTTFVQVFEGKIVRNALSFRKVRGTS